MKKLVFILLMLLFILPMMAFGQSMGERLQGKLLLQVEERGRIWYVAPKDKKRYEVTFANALPLFEQHAVGITNANLDRIRTANKFSNGNSFGKQFAGKLFLQVEDKGRIWYIDFNGLRHEVTWANLMSLFKGLSLGITNIDLQKIPIGFSTKTDEVVQNYYQFIRKYSYRNGVESLTFNSYSPIGYGYLYDTGFISREFAAQTNCGSETCFDDAIKNCTFFASMAVDQGSYYETFGNNNDTTCNVLVIDNPSNGSHFLNSYVCSLSRNGVFDNLMHQEENVNNYASCNKNLIESQRFSYGRYYSYENGVANLEYKATKDDGYEFVYYPDTQKSIRNYKAETNCGSAECFDQAFANCEIGNTLAIGDRDVMYYIHGTDVQTGLCTVRVTQRVDNNFLETISCKLDNSKIIDQALDNEFQINNYKNCSGRFSQ